MSTGVSISIADRIAALKTRLASVIELVRNARAAAGAHAVTMERLESLERASAHNAQTAQGAHIATTERLGLLERASVHNAQTAQGAYIATTERLELLERASVHNAQAVEGARTATMDRLELLERTVDEHRRQIQVRAVMDWIAQASLRTNPLVSVLLPTRNRRELLTRAIGSVQAQTYPHWELLIVDDASTDDTPGFLAGLDVRGVRCFRALGNGPCAARNVALAHARGELIAYLDDDNTMHMEWLKSIVWGFEQQPENNVIYGAFVVDDTARIDRKGRGDLPCLCFRPYDHHAVSVSNIADMGCIAHRAGLPEAHFDETLLEMGDWDLFLRLTRDAPPLGLPAIACFYSTDAPGRLTHGPTFVADAVAVRDKNRR